MRTNKVFGLLVLVLDIITSVQLSSTDCIVPPIKNGAAKLRRRGRKIKYKCYRDFAIVGPPTAFCARGRWVPQNVPICVSAGCDTPTLGEGVQMTYLDMYNHSPVPNASVALFSCQPGHLLVGEVTSWCDSILWSSAPPECQAPWRPPRLSCNFNDIDDQLCGWTIDEAMSGGGVWQVMNGSTPSHGTGPTRAYDGDWYIYLEASGQKENNTGRFVSPVYSSNYSDEYCLQLAFHMQGVDMGSLKVYQKPNYVRLQEDNERFYKLGELSGNYGPGWQLYLLPLRMMNRDFSIVIDGIVGRSYLSDIGLDGIKLLDAEKCMEANLQYTPPRPIPAKSWSPVSCWGRCNMSTDILDIIGGWDEEETCACKTGCLSGPVFCCSDYLSECSVTKISTDFEYSSLFLVSIIGILACFIIIGIMLLLAGVKRGTTLQTIPSPPPPGERLRGDGGEMEQIVQDLDIDLRNPEDDFQYDLDVQEMNKKFEDLENVPENSDNQENVAKKCNDNLEDLEQIDFTLSTPVVVEQDLM